MSEPCNDHEARTGLWVLMVFIVLCASALAVRSSELDERIAGIERAREAPK